jgi:hypothetical protein
LAVCAGLGLSFGQRNNAQLNKLILTVYVLIESDWLSVQDLGLLLASGTMSNSMNPEEIEYLGFKEMREFHR